MHVWEHVSICTSAVGTFWWPLRHSHALIVRERVHKLAAGRVIYSVAVKA